MIFRSVLLCLVLVGCSGGSRPPGLDFVGHDVSASPITAEFELVGQDGNPYVMADFRGKVVALFFGYTHCPDVCPTTMADLSGALKLLGKDRSRVRVLFVTLDPLRDTKDVLARYVGAFGPEFVGLTGSPGQVDAVAKRFGVFYQKQETAGRQGYMIDHAAGIFLLDGAGRPRVYMNYGQKPQEVAHDLRLLL